MKNMKNMIKENELAMILNNATYDDYMTRLKLLATSLFSWENLDEIVGFGASRFLEKVLYENGRACFIKDETKGFMVLRVNPTDKFNVYELPTEVEAFSIGYNEKFDFDEIVYIMNNDLEIPTYNTLQLMAYRLFDTERTIDINRNACKTPILLEGDHQVIMTLKNVYMQYTGNTPVIFGNKKFDLNKKINAIIKAIIV